MHKVSIAIHRVIINKGDEIFIPSTSVDIKRSHTSVCTNSRQFFGSNPFRSKNPLGHTGFADWKILWN